MKPVRILKRQNLRNPFFEIYDFSSMEIIWNIFDNLVSKYHNIPIQRLDMFVNGYIFWVHGMFHAGALQINIMQYSPAIWREFIECTMD